MATQSSFAPAVRSFLTRLRDDRRSVQVPRELHRMASGIVRRLRLNGGEAAADDLVGELLLRLASSTGSRSDGEDLLVLDDHALVGTLKHRLAQLACEAQPRWRLIRSLRTHLRNAMNDSLPDAPEEAPATVEVGQRLCGQRLALSASWLCRASGRSLPVETLATEIAARYFPERDSGGDLEDLRAASSNAMDELGTRRDARRLCARIPAVLGPAGLSALLRVRNGETLTSIAATENRAVASIHARVHGAVSRLRELVHEEGGVAPEALLLALDLLDAGAAERTGLISGASDSTRRCVLG